jgi:peptidylprolyl isomerase
MEDLTGDRGVLKEILVAGSGEHPLEGQEVEVHYVGKLDTGVVFDSSRERDETFSFVLGERTVIKAWEQAVATMKVGEKALFIA